MDPRRCANGAQESRGAALQAAQRLMTASAVAPGRDLLESQ